MTRLDRWYILSHEKIDTYMWHINVRPDLVWSEVPSDHLPVILTVEPMKGERGHQRANLREDLLLQTYHQKKCRSILHDNYKNNPDSTKTRVQKWKSAHDQIFNYLLIETQKLERKRTIKSRQKEHN